MNQKVRFDRCAPRSICRRSKISLRISQFISLRGIAAELPPERWLPKGLQSHITGEKSYHVGATVVFRPAARRLTKKGQTHQTYTTVHARQHTWA